jgi:hypothetical protein
MFYRRKQREQSGDLKMHPLFEKASQLTGEIIAAIKRKVRRGAEIRREVH